MNQLKKQVLEVVEGERDSITYIIQRMNSVLIKVKIKSDSVIDMDIQNDIVRLKDRMNSLETLIQYKI